MVCTQDALYVETEHPFTDWVARFIANSVELASKNSFEVLVAHQTALCLLRKNLIFRRVRNFA
jgi:hypothetical protein